MLTGKGEATDSGAQYASVLMSESVVQSASENLGFSIIGGAYIAPYTVISIPEKVTAFGPTTKAVMLPGDENILGRGQCVNYVRYVAKVDYTGNAKTWGAYVNATSPQVGDIVVMRASWWGHVGIVVKVTDTEITVRSRNYRGLWIISDDVFKIDDSILMGYIRK
jgi:surface antigen